MNNMIKIDDAEMQIKEYNGQRLVTFKDIDTVHCRPKGTAKRNFNKNKNRFVEGEDFIKFCVDEIRTNKIMDISNKTRADVVMITESGYLMIVKSFTDDLSWDVQRRLVNKYFNSNSNQSDTTSLSNVVEPVRVPLRKSWYLDNVEDIRTLAKRHNVSEKRVLHRVLTHLSKKYNLNAANKIYKREVGFSPDYATDIIAYFPELKKMADDFLDEELMKSVEMDWQ